MTNTQQEFPGGPNKIMRTVFHQELADLVDGLVRLSGRVGLAMERAGAALLTTDLQLAEQVIARTPRSTPRTTRSTIARSSCWHASSRWRPTCARSSRSRVSPRT